MALFSLKFSTLVKLMRCPLFCVGHRCSQKRWRNVMYSVCAFPTVGSWWQSFRYRSGWNGGYVWLCYCWTSASLITRVTYILWYSVENFPGEGMEPVNDPKITLVKYDWAWIEILLVLISCSQKRAWLLQTRSRTRWFLSESSIYCCSRASDENLDSPSHKWSH